MKKNNNWFFTNAIKYNKLNFDDDSFRNKFKIKLYGSLRERDYKRYIKYQKKLHNTYSIHNGYLEYSDIFNHILYLITCMGIEYRNFGNTTAETIKEEVRSLWKFRRMVKDFLNIDDMFYDRQNNIIKKKYGKNTELTLKFENKEGLRTSQLKYINNDFGSSADISNYHDVVTVDSNIGIYPVKSDDSIFESAEEKYRKEFFNYMMEFFYKHYRLWWD